MINYPRLSELPDFIPAVAPGSAAFTNYRRAAFADAAANDEVRQHIYELAQRRLATPAAQPQLQITMPRPNALEKAQANVT